MSLESLPVAPAPAAGAPPVKAAPRTAADAGLRFADLVGGVVDAGAEPPPEPAAGPAAPQARPAEDAEPAPDSSALDEAIVAATVPPWALLPPAVGAPASPRVRVADGTPDADCREPTPAAIQAGWPAGAWTLASAPAAPAEPAPAGATAPVSQPLPVVRLTPAGEWAPAVEPARVVHAAPVVPPAPVVDPAVPGIESSPVVPRVEVVDSAPIVLPASVGEAVAAGPAGMAETTAAAHPPVAAAEVVAPHQDGRASRAPRPQAGQGSWGAVTQVQEGAGQPAAEARYVAAAVVAGDVVGHRAGAVSVQASAEGADSSAPDGNAVDRFLRRERGEAPANLGRPAAEPRGVPHAPPDASVSKAVAVASMTGAAATQAAEVAGPPVAMDARARAVSEPGPSSDELKSSLAAQLLNAQRETAGSDQTPAGREESSGSERRPLAGESARGALDALAAQARAPRTALASPGGTAVPAPMLDGLEARFQAWLTQAAETSPVLAPETPDVPDVPGQVVKAIQMQWRDGIGEARVQLRPEHLGTVTVSLRVDHGTVVATVRAESPAALEIIRARQQELQEALEAQGLQVSELEVTLDPEDRRERPAYRQPDVPHPPRRRETNARFEVVA